MIPGYQVTEEISRNHWRILYRGIRVSDGQPVLIKLPARTPARPADLEPFERERALLQGLSLSGILRLSEFVRPDDNDGDCGLVFQDVDGLPLSQFPSSQCLELGDFFKLSLQLTSVLDELHRHEITHGSLNPHAILFNAETGGVWLTDLSMDEPSRMLNNAELAYISPEQTGRMNRVPDYRSDFYSLGVIFYELLTGRPLFHSEDPLEIIHWHIARTPARPVEVNSRIPEPLSGIVMKLLGKTAEQRYQSAAGLRDDLETCARSWAETGVVAPFPLGRRDVSDRFIVSHKLYGRSGEVADLQSTFERVCMGRTSFTLVTGYAGVGKTALIQELYRPIVRKRGYFISGKFDQLVRGTPFGALIQAFSGLIRQLLAETEAQVRDWRERILDALGPNAGVLSEVIPELGMITGEQSAPPSLAPSEALNRFQLVFQNFVGAVARPEHPLVIFLDDLQWADSATLGLLSALLTSPGHSLFLIGAYRDNEVDSNHPLATAVAGLESEGAEIRRLNLEPLRLADVTAFVRDTLHNSIEDSEPLARLVVERTAGNPFFVIQFLKTLRDDGYLKFDPSARRWVYRIDEIAATPITENVIDLMTRKIQRLSDKTQNVLMLAACAGNPFDEQVLAIISERPVQEVRDDLKEAIDEGLVVGALHGVRSPARGDTAETVVSGLQLSFVHDRIQQAAYALIPGASRRALHLKVARLMQARADLEHSDEMLFDILHHLNLGSSLIDDPEELLGLAKLNLAAGLKAKSSTAYRAALDYIRKGIALLSDEQWKTHYELALRLHVEAGECEYLCGNFVEAEGCFETALQHATYPLDKARIFELRIVQCENMSNYSQALANAREGLALLGVSFPDSAAAKQDALEAEIAEIKSLLGDRSVESLIDLPLMTAPETRMVMSILTAVWPSAYISGDQILTRLISAVIVRLSLIHGNCEESAYGYVTHAITVGPVRQDYKSAFEFGMLALKVNKRFNDTRRRAKVLQQFQAHVSPWRQSLRASIPLAREACRSGLETGDFTYATYGAFTESWAALLTCTNLDDFVREYSPNLSLFKRLRAESFAEAQRIILNWARALQGTTLAPLSLSDEEFSEREYAAKYRDNPFFLMFREIARLNVLYLLGEHRGALEAVGSARQIVHHLSGTIWPLVLDFWASLTRAEVFHGASEDEQRLHLEEMRAAQTRLAVLAENCPENFRCEYLLVSAQIEQLSGRDAAAAELYQRAIEFADKSRRSGLSGLAKELRARLHLSLGETNAAAVLMAEARKTYSVFGAAAKVDELERKYPDLIAPGISEPDVRATVEPAPLDVASVMKGAQAIGGEIELDKLLAKLLRIVIENAGAERGYLILEHENEWFIRASGSLDAAEVFLQTANNSRGDEETPSSVINYVRRTRESVVLADSLSDDRFNSDRYITEVHPLSVMCIPLVNQGRLIGVLYLENNVVNDAFTPARIQVCQMLASQAAISLENARLYAEMKQEATQRKEAEETLRSIVEGTAAATGADFFVSLVRHLAAALRVRYAFAAECLDKERTTARSLAFWAGDRQGDNFTFNVAETPCRNVLQGEVCYYPDHIQKLFPGDTDLVVLGAQSYLGIPVRDMTGEIIGHLAVLDDKPMPDVPHDLALLKIFSARAGAELERQRAEAGLRKALEEVERLKNRLHDENVYLQEEIRREHNFEEIVGTSPAILETLTTVERVAPTDSTVLIYGETGTGKELIARAIHSRSARRARPLVKVNCGAISAGLVESELFGHVKGAFTGAIDRRVGRFALADGGTLFLDEVSELPLETQVKLLRVLQEGEFEPVGSSKTVRVDVRIIAATNRDLNEAVRDGRFRSDLFYRLNVLPIEVPSLRQRQTDIPQLVTFFVTRFSKRFGKQTGAVSRETMDLLLSYDWPGNIRELQNVIERGVVLSNGAVLALGPDFLPGSARSRITIPAPISGTLEDVERHHISSVLLKTKGVVEGPNGAARILKLHPNTLRSRMKKLGLR